MKKFLIVILALLLVILPACSPDTPSPSPDNSTVAYRTISPDGAKALLDNGKPIILVDVRTAEEYAERHIPGAILLPNEEIGDTHPEQLLDLDATIVLYCRSGRRSKEAAEKLIALGYTDVRDLGGINDWPYATVTGSEVGTWPVDENTQPANGVMSSFTTESLDGTVIDESVLADTPLTMVNVWATYCPPCIVEMPDLGELAAEYQDKGVQIIGFVSDVLKSDGTLDDKQLDTATEIVAKTQANYLHLLPSPDLYGILISVQSVPTTFFVDKNGNQVGGAYVGAKSKDDWKAIIDQMLSEVSE